MPDFFGMNLISSSFSTIGHRVVLDLSVSPMSVVNQIIKSIEDRIAATLILLAISPLMLLIAIGVKLSSPGPVFYRQERVSWNGKTFGMYKFRSMPVNAEGKTGGSVGSGWRKSSDKIWQFPAQDKPG